MTEKPHMRGWTDNSHGGDDRLTLGQWLRYLGVTFCGKARTGAATRQRGTVWNRIDSMIGSGR